MMEIKDHVKEEFYSFGYEDAKMGRKLSEAYFNILAKAKKCVNTHLGEVNTLIENNSEKLKSTDIILQFSSETIKNWDKHIPNQRTLDDIDKSITILKDDLTDIRGNIDNLSHLMTRTISHEIENIFGTLLDQYETGYKKYKNEVEEVKNDQYLSYREIDYSNFTNEIIDQYSRNSKFTLEDLD